MTIGSDYFSAGLLKLNKRNQKVNLFQFDLRQIPFNDNSIDAFSCLNVLEHVKEDDKGLRELNRVLKPRGLGYIMVPASPSLYDFYDEVHYHFRRYNKKELKSKIKAAGFKIVKLNYIATPLYVPFYLVKKLKNYQMKNKSFEEKRFVVEREIKNSQKSRLSGFIIKLLSIERSLGNYLPYPFGIRLYSLVTNA